MSAIVYRFKGYAFTNQGAITGGQNSNVSSYSTSLGNYGSITGAYLYLETIGLGFVNESGAVISSSALNIYASGGLLNNGSIVASGD